MPAQKKQAETQELLESPELELSKNTRHLAILAADGATDDELSAILGVSLDTLKMYSVLIVKARAEHTVRVRRLFLAAADKGNETALQFLAKKYLEDPV